MTNFNIGEVVRLRSGSPAMVVTSTNEHPQIEVRWCDSRLLMQVDLVHADALELIGAFDVSNVVPAGITTKKIKKPLVDAKG